MYVRIYITISACFNSVLNVLQNFYNFSILIILLILLNISLDGSIFYELANVVQSLINIQHSIFGLQTIHKYYIKFGYSFVNRDVKYTLFYYIK